MVGKGNIFYMISVQRGSGKQRIPLWEANLTITSSDRSLIKKSFGLHSFLTCTLNTWNESQQILTRTSVGYHFGKGIYYVTA